MGAREGLAAGQAQGLAVVAVEPELLVLDKPAGLLSVPGRGADKADCLAARVQAVWPEALVVHRLDQATSGLMLMARGLAAQRWLSAAFERRTVAKRYLAVVAGRMGPAQGEIDAPLAADWPNRPRQQVDRAHGRPALTRWRVLAHDAATNRTRVELEPVTGRSHQLRVHLQSVGHPIVGDALYGPPDVALGADRLLLHAAELRLAIAPGAPETVFRSHPPF